jgi:hypothetical protein
MESSGITSPLGEAKAPAFAQFEAGNAAPEVGNHDTAFVGVVRAASAHVAQSDPG